MNNDSGTYKMPYGKFAFEALTDIPSWYLKWVAENIDDEIICKNADTEYQFREKHNSHFNNLNKED